jgi:serine/threonine protein kinase
MNQAYDAMNYMVSLKIFHRDIKPDNILLKDGNIRLTDFGLSKSLQD